jgi:hypothetical protein
MRISTLAERVEGLVKDARAQKQLHGVIINNLREEDFIDLLNASFESDKIKIIYLNKFGLGGKYHHRAVYVDGNKRLRFATESVHKIYDL